MKEYFEFLDKLRGSGVTNMFGATPYLVGEFDISSEEARGVLVKWMNSFDEDERW